MVNTKSQLLKVHMNKWLQNSQPQMEICIPPSPHCPYTAQRTSRKRWWPVEAEVGKDHWECVPPGQGRADALRTSQQRGSCSRPNVPLFYLIATSSHRDGNVSNPDTPKKNHHMLPSCTGLHPHKKQCEQWRYCKGHTLSPQWFWYSKLDFLHLYEWPVLLFLCCYCLDLECTPIGSHFEH